MGEAEGVWPDGAVVGVPGAVGAPEGAGEGLLEGSGTSHSGEIVNGASVGAISGEEGTGAVGEGGGEGEGCEGAGAGEGGEGARVGVGAGFGEAMGTGTEPFSGGETMGASMGFVI